MVQKFSKEPVTNACFIQVLNVVYSFAFSGFDQPKQETRVTFLFFNEVKQAIEFTEVCRLDWKCPIGSALSCYKNSEIYFSGGQHLLNGSLEMGNKSKAAVVQES